MLNNKKKFIGNIIFWICFVIVLIFFYNMFEKYNFNDYEKSEYYSKRTDFIRDSKNKYSKIDSYKLSSNEYNDAIFYKTIKVEKNTPYKVTCMVKTNNIETQKNSSNAGANISIIDTTEKSKSITGTSDWQKIELLFDSKNREEIKIGFRLRRI